METCSSKCNASVGNSAWTFLGSLLGSTAVVEIIYNWPGMGNMAVKAISCRDYPLVQGYVLWIAILYMCINLLVDLSYTYLDPRLKEDR